MALSTSKVTITAMPSSDLAELTTQFNNLCDVLATWAAGFDTDSGIAATTHVSGLEAAVAKIASASGVEQ